MDLKQMDWKRVTVLTPRGREAHVVEVKRTPTGGFVLVTEAGPPERNPSPRRLEMLREMDRLEGRLTRLREDLDRTP